MSYREELLKLKEEAWEAEDYKLVKEIRMKIKEFDRAHPSPKLKRLNTIEDMLKVKEIPPMAKQE